MWALELSFHPSCASEVEMDTSFLGWILVRYCQFPGWSSQIDKLYFVQLFLINVSMKLVWTKAIIGNIHEFLDFVALCLCNPVFVEFVGGFETYILWIFFPLSRRRDEPPNQSIFTQGKRRTLFATTNQENSQLENPPSFLDRRCRCNKWPCVVNSHSTGTDSLFSSSAASSCSSSSSSLSSAGCVGEVTSRITQRIRQQNQHPPQSGGSLRFKVRSERSKNKANTIRGFPSGGPGTGPCLGRPRLWPQPLAPLNSSVSIMVLNSF